MQIIVSSIAFQRIIQNALDQSTFIFHVYGRKAIMEFTGKEIIEFPVVISGGYARANYSGDFNPDKWKKIMEFLKQLPKYPVTIRFFQSDSDDYEINKNPDIRLSEFIMDF